MTHPAGWYPDPSNQTQQRYWDGQSWSEHTRPAAPMPLPVVPAKKQTSAFRTVLTILGVILVVGVGISFFTPEPTVRATEPQRAQHRIGPTPTGTIAPPTPNCPSVTFSCSSRIPTQPQGKSTSSTAR